MIRIGNLGQIKSAYGAEAAEWTVSKLRQMAEERFGQPAAIFDGAEAGLIRLSGSSGSARGFGDAIANIAETPIEWEGHVLHLALEDLFLSERMEPPCGASRARAFGGDIARLRADMMLATNVLAALKDGDLDLAWQPVVAAAETIDVLYYEALTRLGNAQPDVATAIAALERTGLIRAFDRRIVSMVISELEHSEDAVLGVNISASSATHDFWWTSIFDRLRTRPDAARRLVIEITETAPLAPGSHRLAFELRELGCRIALDDFGVGHASVRQLLALAPDIVKVDRFFVHGTATASRQKSAFIHLVGLAGSLAPAVVIEGVETGEQHRHVAKTLEILPPGTERFVQGRFYGAPSISRPWCVGRALSTSSAGPFRSSSGDRSGLAVAGGGW